MSESVFPFFNFFINKIISSWNNDKSCNFRVEMKITLLAELGTGISTGNEFHWVKEKKNVGAQFQNLIGLQPWLAVSSPSQKSGLRNWDGMTHISKFGVERISSWVINYGSAEEGFFLSPVQELDIFIECPVGTAMAHPKNFKVI